MRRTRFYAEQQVFSGIRIPPYPVGTRIPPSPLQKAEAHLKNSWDCIEGRVVTKSQWSPKTRGKNMGKTNTLRDRCTQDSRQRRKWSFEDPRKGHHAGKGKPHWGVKYVDTFYTRRKTRMTWLASVRSSTTCLESSRWFRPRHVQPMGSKVSCPGSSPSLLCSALCSPDRLEGTDTMENLVSKCPRLGSEGPDIGAGWRLSFGDRKELVVGPVPTATSFVWHVTNILRVSIFDVLAFVWVGQSTPFPGSERRSWHNRGEKTLSCQLVHECIVHGEWRSCQTEKWNFRFHLQHQNINL